VSERVADRDIQPAATVPRGMVIPDETRWTVVLDPGGQPAAAISPGGTSVAENPVVADAALPVALLLQSQALARATAGTVVVVTAESAVVGIWAGQDLVDALVHGATREAGWAFAGDVQLPGVVTKKNITCRCRHAEPGISCPARRERRRRAAGLLVHRRGPADVPDPPLGRLLAGQRDFAAGPGPVPGAAGPVAGKAPH
jgi:hypothetical protein